MSTLIVAGLDPSLSNFGLVKGILDLSGSSPTFNLTDMLLQESKATDKKSQKVVRKNSDDLDRARLLHTGMTEFIRDVDIVCVEIPVGSQSARAMASYGICIGVIASINKPLIQVTPTEVKVAATGRKTATKAEMIEWATSIYPSAGWLTRVVKGQTFLVSKNEHLADALAAIKAGVQTDTFKQMQAFYKLAS